MLEKQIDIDKQFKFDLAELKNCLKNSGLCKIIADNDNDETYQLMYACNDEHMSHLDNIVAHKLTEFYVYRYKKYYLEHHINLSGIDKMFVPAYICAIASFDTFTDKEISLEADYTTSKIVAIPFLYFRLSGLIQRWQTIANLTNDNIDCLDKTNGIIDLLSYLVKNQQNITKNLELYFTDNGIKIYNESGLKFESKSQTKSDVADMMAVLVKLCPQRLKINAVNANSHIDTIRRIFSERVI